MTNTPYSPDDFPWVDCDKLKELPGGRSAILFGAGQGSVEFMRINRLLPSPLDITAVADNDATMWGKGLEGLPIVSPDSLGDYGTELIVITTISGKETVARQLAAMGYSEGRDFLAVGKFPSQSLTNLQYFLRHLDLLDLPAKGDTILHVGPGGFLGLECCLHALGFSAISMDANSFGITYPDVTDIHGQYRQTLEQLLALPLPGHDKNLLKTRYLSLFSESDGRIFLDQERLPYHFPHFFSAIPLDDNSVDMVISFAVLEHVRNPETALREMRRVLKPNGRAFHKIITRDHRSFSHIGGYHPFSYLGHTNEEWEAINRDKFYQNRLLPHEWRDLFSEHMRLDHFTTLQPYDLPDPVLAEVTRHRPDLRREHLDALNCLVVARRE